MEIGSITVPMDIKLSFWTAFKLRVAGLIRLKATYVTIYDKLYTVLFSMKINGEVEDTIYHDAFIAGHNVIVSETEPVYKEIDGKVYLDMGEPGSNG